MADIIITGVSGFVGSNLSAYLQQKDYTVLPLSLRGAWQQQSPPKASAIIHLAGKAHDLKQVADAEEYSKINTELTQTIFDWFLVNDIADFIYFSSVKAVADKVDGILTEDTEPAPGTAYGRSKLAAETYLLSKNLPEGKRLFIIRPCMIHGPGNKGNLNLLYHFVQKGLPWPLAAFDNQRSFLSIDNLCFVIQNLLSDKNVPSGIFNLADDEVLSTNEVIKIIARATGRKQWLMYLPASIIKGLARLGDRLNLPLNSERLQKLTENYVVSNRKIKTALGIDRLPLPAAEGLKKTIGSFDADND